MKIPPRKAKADSGTAVNPVDLLLCGHHYLRSRAALAAADAVAIDETGAVLEPAPTSTETTSPRYADTTLRR